MNHLDLAFMLVFTALATTAFTAGVIMLYLAKALNAETLRAVGGDEEGGGDE